MTRLLPVFAAIRITGLTLLLVGAWGAAVAAGPCARTPEAAVRGFESGVAADDAADGYRVTGVRSDAVLGLNWASVGRCGHPEWPGMSLPMGRVVVQPALLQGAEVATRTEAAQKLVRPGQTVRLWRQDANLRMETAAVSDESGAVGERVRMHMVTRLGGVESVRYVFGLVRGPADVEMEW